MAADGEETSRLAANEAAFRDINETIRRAASRYVADEHRYEFLCECSDARCFRTITLTVAEYRDARKKSNRFLLVPGHEDSRIERVIERHEAFEIVEKIGEAAQVADDLD